ncbi:MAG: MoxR family ATPase [Phycisphaerales bacterium]|nr:MoxR family ATPase [Phycisphaerales bacterium]
MAMPTAEAFDAGLDDIASVQRRCAAFRDLFTVLRREVGKVVVGQDQVVEQTLVALLANGHVLLEGVPGLGKTLLVRTLGEALSLPFSRIQFTPDLMPSDITGTTVVVDDPTTGRRRFDYRPGPIFAQLVLADEINRATPKSQAALLEAMQERSVSVGGVTRPLASPFFVMATQNPIEQEGTYPLPEAQLDRFLLKIVVPYATREEVGRILDRTTRSASQAARPVIDGPRILQAQRLARRIVVPPFVQDWIVRLVLSTHPGSPHMPSGLDNWIAVGVSPRGAQAIVSTAKVKALIDGRYAVAFADVEWAALPALRQRIIRTFEAEADGIDTDEIVRRLLQRVPRGAGLAGGADAAGAR